MSHQSAPRGLATSAVREVTPPLVRHHIEGVCPPGRQDCIARRGYAAWREDTMRPTTRQSTPRTSETGTETEGISRGTSTSPGRATDEER